MTLHLLHAPLDMRALSRWGGERGLLRRGFFDHGYALHVLLAALFGKGALQPFRLFSSERRRAGALYAYSRVAAPELRAMADAVGPPDCLEVLDPERLRAKPMRSSFDRSQTLGFDLRLRPVRRVRRNLAESGRPFSKGGEVDVYRLELLRRFPSLPSKEAESSDERRDLTRQAVYTSWLAERFGDAAAVDDCSLTSFRRTRVVRGKSGSPEGPDAVLHGTLTVKDEAAFSRFLDRGIGRHRAYGYGMLLLRPPGRQVPGT